MLRTLLSAVLIGVIAFVLSEIDVYALRIYYHDGPSYMTPHDVVARVAASEPTNCKRLPGPIGAEDGVLLSGTPSIILTSELDAAVHEFTNLADHGTAASTAPTGTLWAIDRLDKSLPRLTPLNVPLPEGVTRLHTHGLALYGDVLYAANHAFGGGGERIERWRVTRLHGDGDDGPIDGPPVVLVHLGAITGHTGDGQAADDGSWTFMERLNGAINGISPDGGANPAQPSPLTGVFLTQFLEGPANTEGSGSGVAAPADAEPVAAALRHVARRLGLEAHASVLLPRLFRTRIFHCACLPADAAVGGGVEDDAGGESACVRTSCRAIGPPSTKWNGIEFVPAPAGSRRLLPDGRASRGRLYVNDIFRRLTAEFEVVGEGVTTDLVPGRTFRHPFMVDNLRIDASGKALWVGAVGHSLPNLMSGIHAVVANATRAHQAARAAGAPTPRPHLHLRPRADRPPQPPMVGGLLRLDLESGTVTQEVMQATLLASISWGMRVAGKEVMGSPWDDGVLVCS